MNAHRLQHVIPASLVSFLFPRLIAAAMLVLAVWNFIRAAGGFARVGGVKGKQLLAILPGLLVMLIYVFFAAKKLGFYAASVVAFFVLYSLYDPASHTSPKVWLKRVVVTLIFMVVIFGLFAMLLRVQTPLGLYDNHLFSVYRDVMKLF